MEVSAVISPSPSFSSYSNANLVEVANRVVQDQYDVDKQEKTTIPENDGGREEEEFEFKFAFESLPPLSADEIFHEGIILPIYANSFFGNVRDHGSVDGSRMNSGLLKGVKIGTPLRKLFTEERETSSSSSSEADELDRVSAEMYCVWQPKPSAEGRLKKSSYTGWKFRSFLRKSQC